MELRQKDANGIASSEDPDQTVPLGSLRYLVILSRHRLVVSEKQTIK